MSEYDILQEKSNATAEMLDDMIRRSPELAICKESIWNAYLLLLTCFSEGGKLLIAGNGGSAADSEHIVGELMKGFHMARPVPASVKDAFRQHFDLDTVQYLSDHLQGALPAISLVSHSALISAFANDVSADMVYAQQIYGYGKKSDAVLLLSTSGNSSNIVRAAQICRALGLTSIAITGESGGKLLPLCTQVIRVPSKSTPVIQEKTLCIYHALCAMAEYYFFS